MTSRRYTRNASCSTPFFIEPGPVVPGTCYRTICHPGARFTSKAHPPATPDTTVANPAAIVAENLLLVQPAPTAPNQVWVGDITYLPLSSERWCYLATWRGTCSRRVSGWHLDIQIPTELMLTALE